jgi:urease accessory protein
MELRKLAVAAVPIALLLAWPIPAFAHEAESLRLGIVGGMLHPFSGPDHLLAMVAVGIWGAFLGRPLIYLLPVVFPTLMAVGGVIAMAGIAFPPVEIGIAVSVIVLGVAILGAYRAPVWLATIVVGLFGLFHGYAHGLELPSMVDPIGFSLGFVMATGLLHVAGIVIGLVVDRPGGQLLLRAIGGAIAAAGLWFLYQAL